MRSKSLLSSVLMCVISVLGLVSHYFAIQSNSFSAVALAVVLYMSPLLIDVLEDFEHVMAYNYLQYIIDKFAALSGILYLLFLGIAIVFETKNVNLIQNLPLVVQSGMLCVIKIFMMIPPALFVVKKSMFFA